MRFKDFLDEGRYSKLPSNVMTAWDEKAGDLKEAVKWIMTNNLSAIESGDLIFRGFSGGVMAEISFIDSSQGRRMSRDSSGIYQLMMDASDAFKDFPSRSNSFICTTDPSGTKRYGSPYVIFPKKGTVIAVSEEEDFWSTMISGDAASAYGLRDIESLTVRLAQLLRSKFDLKPVRGMTISDIDKAVSKISPDEFLVRMEIKNASVQKKILDRIEAQGGKNYFTAMSNILATPDNFTVETSIYGKSKAPDIAAEIWFSGEVLVIDHGIMSKVLEALPDEVNIQRALRTVRSL